ncbi:MAG: hypothetical protein BWY71_01723 [Planctomycetes bacterium ADurb.Bin412]|nr:MAG: hypothetical protein BWY71_01723 [Planctomycetes bacterium ADurb.Bin412]
MSGYARVGSIEVLREFRASLCTFAHTAATALEESYSEIQRTALWLKQQQYSHWKSQVRICSEEYQKARLGLKSKQNYDASGLGAKYSYIDEKKILAAAQRKLELAQQKLANVQRWATRFEKESFDYKGLIQGLMDVAEVEIPNAMAQLDRMVDMLESYVALTPQADGPVEATGELSLTGMARDEPPAAGFPALYPALRQAAPSQVVRNHAPASREIEEWLTGHTIPESQRQEVAGLDIERFPAAAEEKLVLARCREYPQRIYLLRAQSSPPGDSGWYIGPIKPEEDMEYLSLSIGEVLKMRPDLAVILEFPAGFLVLLNGNSIEVVLDADDRTVWQAGMSHSSG